MRKLLFFACICLMLTIQSCTTDQEPISLNNLYSIDDATRSGENMISKEYENTDSALMDFARILSRVVYARKDVREFLKNKALESFDMNTDVLYEAVKNDIINSNSFREILIAYSSEANILAIEEQVPLLNILLPDMPMFNLKVENMDCSDNEIPVAVSVEKGMSLFLNGNFEMVVPNGELPAFYSFVVNENTRVVVNPTTRSNGRSYEFRSPNFDRYGESYNLMTRSDVELSSRGVGNRAVKAYSRFHGEDGGKDSKAFQRDYIYYGMSPGSLQGTFNHSAAEYISFIEVNPLAYFNISDQQEGQTYDDPHIVENSVTVRGREATTDELIKKFWSENAYNFRFEICSSNSSIPTVVLVPFSPEDLWDFNYDIEYVHGTWFRDSKNTYKIDPKKFTSKVKDLSDEKIWLGKWDLSQESMERYVNIWEEDKSTIVERTVEYEVTKLTKVKVDGSIKFGIGTGTDGTISSGLEESTTNRELKKFTYTRQEQDDLLGTVKIYFYDPIIEGKNGINYIVRKYNTGSISFGISVK